jgi:hypothetical protein
MQEAARQNLYFYSSKASNLSALKEIALTASRAPAPPQGQKKTKKKDLAAGQLERSLRRSAHLRTRRSSFLVYIFLVFFFSLFSTSEACAEALT